jgi:hypothetical protein
MIGRSPAHPALEALYRERYPQFLRLFLAGGQQIRVPLRDNAYAVDAARTQFPARLVAYNADGQAIGIQELTSDGITP